MISFSGIDGSGKSTLAKRTCEYLNAKGIKAIKLDVYSRSLFLSIGKLISKVSKNAKSDIESVLASSDKKAGTLSCVLRRICFRIDIALFKMTSFAIKVQGRMPVCDRYLYDTLIHLKHLGAVDEKSHDLFLSKIPKPDVAILLLLDDEGVAKAREDAHEEIEYYIEKITLYKELAEKQSLLQVDSSVELETVWREVKDIIDSKVASR